MQKKIIALAIAAAFAAPVAMADTANVNVYGALNMSIDQVNNTADERGRVSSNNSNFGFKGTEDLGDGLSAIFQFELAIGMDEAGLTRGGTTSATAASAENDGNTTTRGTLGQRNTFMGLSSKTMGALTLGNQESPMKTSIGKLDLFGNTIADYRSLMAPQVRGASSVLYATPVFSGLSAKYMYSARDEDGADGQRDYQSANLTYENGPIFAAIAQERSNSSNAAGIDTSRVGAGYTLGDAKVGLGYNMTKADATTATFTKSTSWMVNGAYKMGKSTLKAQYLEQSNNTLATGEVGDTGATQFTIGVDYELSKRTSLYALHTTLVNDSATNKTLGANTGVATVTGPQNGADLTALSFGMIHKF